MFCVGFSTSQHTEINVAHAAKLFGVSEGRLEDLKIQT